MTYMYKDINYDILKRAISITFKHRDSEKYLEDFNDILEELSKNKELKLRWDKYTKEHEYAKEVSYEEVINSIKKMYERVRI